MHVFSRFLRLCVGYSLLAFALFVPPATAQDAYRLAPGDTVQVLVIPGLDEPVSLKIDNEGRIIMPLVGAIGLGGLTTAEAERIVSDTMTDRQVYADPTVAVSLVAPREVFVTGDVRNAGAFPGRIGMRVDEAIALAGGTRAEARTELSAGNIAELQGDLLRVVAEVEALDIKRARYEAEAEGRPFSFDGVAASAQSSGAFIARMRDLEMQDYLVSEQTYQRELAAMSEALAILAEEKQAIEGQQEALRKIVELFDEERERSADLVERGLVTAGAGLASERNLFSARAELMDQVRRFAQAEANELELRTDIEQLADRRRQSAFEELSQIELQRVTLIAERDAITSRLGYSSVYSANAGGNAGELAQAQAEGSVEAEVTLVRKMPNGERQVRTVSDNDIVAPGDLLVVRILPNFSLLQ